MVATMVVLLAQGEEGPIQESPVGEGPFWEGLVGEDPAGKGLVSEGPVEEGSVGDGPAGKGSVGEGPAGEGSVGEGPAGEGPAGEAVSSGHGVTGRASNSSSAFSGPESWSRESSWVVSGLSGVAQKKRESQTTVVAELAVVSPSSVRLSGSIPISTASIARLVGGWLG